MSARAFLAALALSLPLVSQAAIYNRSIDLTNQSLVSDAGRVMNLPTSIDVKLADETILGTLEVSDWTSREFCVEYGPSPNGEPELAECLKTALAWGPRLKMKDVEISFRWIVADLKKFVAAKGDVDLTRCIREGESIEIVQATKPTQSLPTITIAKDCLGYSYVETRMKKASPLVADADVDVEAKFGNFLKFDMTSDLVVVGGKIDATQQAIAKKGVTTDSSWTQIIVDLTVQRQGQTIRLLNYPAVVYFR